MSFVREGAYAAEGWRPTRCPVTKALEIIGTRSAIILLREAFGGTKRFDVFCDRTGITEAVAAARLKEMVEQGLFAKEPYQEPGQRTRYEYHLTQMGRDLLPVLVSLMQWGDQYLQGEPGPVLDLTHRDCGEPVSAEVRCAGGHLLGDGEISMRPTQQAVEWAHACREQQRAATVG